MMGEVRIPCSWRIHNFYCRASWSPMLRLPSCRRKGERDVKSGLGMAGAMSGLQED